ncbi:MAG: RDD family protein [Thermoplasmata archaeon]
MVDLGALANDLVQGAAFYLLPPLLWLFLFLLVWRDSTLARASGFERRAFWLLVPGSLLGVLSNLPIFPWNGNILAVNIGGAALPVTLSLALLARRSHDPLGEIVTYLAGLSVVSGAMLAIVFALPPGRIADLAYLAALVLPPVAMLAVGRARTAPSTDPATLGGYWLAATSVVLGLTFAATATVPGVGIVSQFPFYLAAPVAGGLLGVALPRVLHRPREEGLSLAYALTTLGVLLGADLLRQPPLYASGSNVYAIGGAGPLDLVYLSGLIALAVAYLALRGARLERSPLVRVDAPSAPRTPAARLRRALVLGVRGDAPKSLRESAGAAEEAAHQSRGLLGLSAPAPGASPWEGLPVPSWVVADQRNLASLAARGSTDPQDAYRAWLAARWLVRFGRDLDRRRFAALRRRIGAFLVDLVIVTSPAVVVWCALALAYRSDPSQLATSAAFNASLIGYSAVALLYFAGWEAISGTTLGKWRLGLEVRDRALRRPTALAVLVRNLPKLVPLTILGIGTPLVVALAILGPSALGSSVSGPAAAIDAAVTSLVVVAFVVVGVGVCGAVGALAITASSESQRVGDLLAGTWVVERATPTATPWGSPSAPSGAPGPFG